MQHGGKRTAGPGKKVGRPRKTPEEKKEKLTKLTIAISPDEAIELAQVLSLSKKSQRQALMAGVAAIKQLPDYLDAASDNGYPPY